MRITHVAMTIALAGCGGMMSGSESMRGSVDDAVEENQLHVSTADILTTMPAMYSEVDRHTARMRLIMTDMDDHMASFGHCGGMTSMMDVRDSMRGEVDAHAVTMHTMLDMTYARLEVRYHHDAMTVMLDDMNGMIGGMHCSGW